MDDIKRRFDFECPPVQIQAVVKLWNMITAKKSKLGIITSTTPEVAELVLMWEKCADSTVLVSDACGQALVALALNGYAEIGYILNGFLNLTSSAKNTRPLIKGVADLLASEAKTALSLGEFYRCPYSLRSPTHPFINILTNRLDSWPLLLEQTTQFFSDSRESISNQALEILSPFFKFVLLDPNLKHFEIQPPLFNLLEEVAAQGNQEAIDFLCKSTTWMQLNPLEPLVQTYHRLLSLNKLFFKLNPNNSRLCSFLSVQLMSICPILLQEGLDITSALCLLQKIFNTVDHISDLDVLITLATHLLSICPWHYYILLIPVCKCLIAKSSNTCDSLVNAMLILPLLQTVASASNNILCTEEVSNNIQHLAIQLIMTIETGNEDEKDFLLVPSQCQKPHQGMNAEYYQAYIITDLAKKMEGNLNDINTWLCNVEYNCNFIGDVDGHIVRLISAILIRNYHNNHIMNKCLDTLIKIVNCDFTKGYLLYPLILYRLSKTTDSQMVLNLLTTLTKVSSHKVSIGPVLKTLQLMSKADQLKPVVVRLMTSLWKSQDRIFPQLQSLVLESTKGKVNPFTNVNELLLAKAATIRDICIDKPHQHGADLLPAMSTIIKECTDNLSAPIVALIVEGICALCQAEVVDIRTTWRVLASKLTRDKRPLVLKRLFEMFSLVPSLDNSSQEYEEFTKEIITLLWRFINSNSHPTIVGAAYQALAEFNAEMYTFKHLPQVAKEDLKLPPELSATPFERAKLPEDVLKFIPGSCYTKLLMNVESNILPDFQVFLTSQVKTEVNNLPRGIYYSARRDTFNTSSLKRILNNIPKFLQSMHERGKQPGLHGSLAVGMLLSFNPTLEIGKDGQPTRRSLVEQARSFQHIMQPLLNEVQIEVYEWHRTLILPIAWSVFMDRAYLTSIEGRRAELEMQQTHGQASNTEDFKEKLDTSWLRIRDKLTDDLKTASRGQPIVQANSVLALAGLASSVMNFVNMLDSKSKESANKATEYISNLHWLTMVTDTILTILDGKHEPKGRIFNFCQNKTSRNPNFASMLARACAAVGLSQLVPALVTSDTEQIFYILNLLLVRLPGQPGYEEYPVLNFHFSLALGMFLAKLFKEQFFEASGPKGFEIVMEAVDTLEKCCMNDNLESRSGAILALTLVLTAMSSNSNPECRTHLVKMHQTLSEYLMTLDTISLEYQALVLCLSALATTSYSANIIPAEEISKTGSTVEKLHQENPQCAGTSLALGLLLHGLQRAGYTGFKNLQQQYYTEWLANLGDESCPTLNRIASINGLFALLGSESLIIQLPKIESRSIVTEQQYNDIIRLSSQALVNSRSLAIQSVCSWMLGLLFMSATTSSEAQTGVPDNYSYMKESSILRSCVNLLIESGKAGSDNFNPEITTVLLSSLAQKFTQPLPPVNWTNLLSPFLRQNIDVKNKLMCLETILHQSPSSPSASLFLASWITQPLLESLDDECQAFLFESLHLMIKTVPMDSLNSFVNEGIHHIGRVHIEKQLCQAFITGLEKSLKTKDLSHAQTLLLFQTVERIFPVLSAESNLKLYHHFCDCLGELPDEILDRLTDIRASASLFRSTYVRCHLVGLRKQPLAWLNHCIEAALPHSDSHIKILEVLLSCFQRIANDSTKEIDASHRQWLEELMGYISNVAQKNVFIDLDNDEHKLAVHFLIQVFSAVISSWLSKNLQFIVGIHLPDSSTCQIKNLTRLLPVALPLLVNHNIWDEIITQVIDWLITMLSLKDILDEDIYNDLLGGLTSLRHHKAFKKLPVWTKALTIVM